MSKEGRPARLKDYRFLLFRPSILSAGWIVSGLIFNPASRWTTLTDLQFSALNIILTFASFHFGEQFRHTVLEDCKYATASEKKISKISEQIGVHW